MITITRKIQVHFNCEKEQVKTYWETLYKWQRICHKAANWISTHHYMQENLKEFTYLAEGTKIKLANIDKDADGILTMSRDNTTYRVLSNHFKGEAPMGMLSALNMTIVKTFKQEAQDVRFGKKSLRSYRGNLPLPVRMGDVNEFVKQDDGNYTFKVYGLAFRTFFGRDLSGNELIFDRSQCGDYKLCDSSFLLDGKKVFLLAVFQFEKESRQFDADKEAVCYLDPECPIKVDFGNGKLIEIGNTEGFIHRRVGIRGAVKRMQKGLIYSKGGKGRNKKLAALERMKSTESDFVNTSLHSFSARLIRFCLDRKTGRIILSNYEQIKKDGETTLKDSKEPLLRSWSFGGLAQMIIYKAAKYGIEVITKNTSDESIQDKSKQGDKAGNNLAVAS